MDGISLCLVDDPSLSCLGWIIFILGVLLLLHCIIFYHVETRCLIAGKGEGLPIITTIITIVSYSLFFPKFGCQRYLSYDTQTCPGGALGNSGLGVLVDIDQQP